MPFKKLLGYTPSVGTQVTATAQYPSNPKTGDNSFLDLKVKLSTNDRLSILKATSIGGSEIDATNCYQWGDGQPVYDEDLKLPFTLRTAIHIIDSSNRTSTTFDSNAASVLEVGDFIFGITSSSANKIDLINGQDVYLGTVSSISGNTITVSFNPSTATSYIVGTNKLFKVQKKKFFPTNASTTFGSPYQNGDGTNGVRGLQFFFSGLTPENDPGSFNNTVNIYQSISGGSTTALQSQIDDIKNDNISGTPLDIRLDIIEANYANKALSNLNSTAINQSLLPNVTNLRNLGSNLLEWAFGYFRRVNASTAIATPLLGVDTIDSQDSSSPISFSSRQLSNVADGTNTNDVVNFGQLNTKINSSQTVLSFTNTTTNSNIGTYGSSSYLANGGGVSFPLAGYLYSDLFTSVNDVFSYSINVRILNSSPKKIQIQGTISWVDISAAVGLVQISLTNAAFSAISLSSINILPVIFNSGTGGNIGDDPYDKGALVNISSASNTITLKFGRTQNDAGNVSDTGQDFTSPPTTFDASIVFDFEVPVI